ncbi:mesoderm induction early response protein 1 isoform X2 [Fopius arisanus]|uniref:Mesoderm induction early response protein 1 isoform X2 n=1 Tax=Fopius arisanus TaxID=64838 RepID=A0A9R1TFJ5_9HYME|nr:PREDICTED: mesoderm induction early response protein 1 isoform X2 [Fopius arisanus]
MLQDSRSSRTSGGAAPAGGGRTITRRMTGNGCSRRSERNYNIGPTSDLIVNDFDDERTLDEEEAMEGSEDSHNELSNLQKEGDMPLKELLAKYYGRTSPDSNSSDPLPLAQEDDADPVLQSSEKNDNEGDDFEDEDEGEYEDDDSQPSLRQFYSELVKEKEAERLGTTGKSAGVARRVEAPGDGIPVKNPPGSEVEMTNDNNPTLVADEEINYEDEEEEDDSEDSESTGAPGITVPGASDAVGGGGSGSGGGGSSRLLRSVSRPQSEEEDDDCDYSPDEEEWKKTIMVGSDYQATIPEGLCRYDDALPYENEDKILWNPSFIPERETEEFLERAQLPSNKSTSLPAGAHVRDDEQALYLLLQCGYNLEEALRRRRMNVLPPIDAISLWSEEECHNFESGLRTYGKDFHLIQKNKVRTRSVGELVQFYYLWKKTERHDIFTYKARLEKKKYALHPGITDYMDRFLEEQEGVRDRSSSPNVNCLLHGDVKRQRTSANLSNNHEGKSELWDNQGSEDPSALGSDVGVAEAPTSLPPSSPLSILPPPPLPPLPPPAKSSSGSPTPFTPSSELPINSTPPNHPHEFSTSSDTVSPHLPP